MKSHETLLAVCLILTPARLRAIRAEQWRADLRDGPAMGISAGSLLAGAARSSATARLNDVLHRGGNVLSRITKGENMKLALAITGAAAILIGGAAAGIQANATQEQAVLPVVKAPVMDRPIAGYEGWWNSTPVSGNAEGLPQETVTVDTRTGRVVDAFSRVKNDAGEPTLVADVNYVPVPDASWPADSIVIIDTTSGRVIEDFLVDERSVPLEDSGRPLDATAG